MTGNTIFGPWTLDDLAVLEVANGEWRVSDLRDRGPGGPLLVGFVSRRRDRYYATQATPSAIDRPFADLESAVRYLEDEYVSDADDLERTLPWPGSARNKSIPEEAHRGRPETTD
ncbi:MAG TPA: hypothetical protein VGM94_07135 [Galbitalea sp.]|jgi:hypothetical protein